MSARENSPLSGHLEQSRLRAGSTCDPPSFLLASSASLMLLATFSPAQVKPWNQIQPPPLPAFKPQEPVRVQLPNGMVIFLQEDHELPLIDATARIRGGSISETANKTGLTDLYGEVWRTGGTKTKTGDQMDDFLEARAAKIETDNQSDSTSISLNCLKGDFDAVFDMFLDLLHNPEFRPDKLELAKEQMYTEISRRNDNVDSIVHRESRIIAYGKDNPYARVPEYATVAARHSRGPAELAPAIRLSQQHHLRHHRRLRCQGHGSQAAPGIRIVAEGARREGTRHQVHASRSRACTSSARPT